MRGTAARRQLRQRFTLELPQQDRRLRSIAGLRCYGSTVRGVSLSRGLLLE